MQIIDVQPLVAWWGAILSTLLAAIKLAELWRDRFRVDISYSFTSSESIGSTIYIRNISGKPMILAYWSVEYGSGLWPCRRFEMVSSPEHDVGDIRIESHSTFELKFVGQDNLSTNEKVLKGRNIYIRLHVAGKNEILRKIYP